MIALLLILAASVAVIGTAAYVALDGYGSRPAPRSHPQDAFEPRRVTDRTLAA